jgi:sortase A
VNLSIMDSATADEPPVAPSPRKRSRGGRVLTVIGVLLLATGLACFGYVGYQLYGTNFASKQAYETGREELRQQWGQDGDGSAGTDKGDGDKGDAKGDKDDKPKPVPGNAIALMSIPSIGLKEIPILEGTTDQVLAEGIGHYSNTAMPGEVGNFAVAGHRITHGEPFANLLQLNQGDEVIVETRDAIYTYAIDTAPQTLTVNDTESWVIDPVPGEPDAEPTEELITLTTCQDLFHSPDRSVGFGSLIDSEKK